MPDLYHTRIATELNLRPEQVAATVRLLDDDATVPFIARYRKEMTGSLDEVAITAIRDRLHQLRDLDKRRNAILTSLEERELLTDELRASIVAAATMAELEDIYLPYRPKRRTRATIARERGLEPLAELVFEQDPKLVPEQAAEAFVDPEREVATVDDALTGARDIIAEWINEDTTARARMRSLFARRALLYSHVLAGKEAEGAKYSDYFDWEEPVVNVPSHRILAMRRGETEAILSLRIAPPEELALDVLAELFIDGRSAASEQVRMALKDSYKRLLAPAMETEIRNELKDRADEEAIRVFAENLRELLMSPPLGRKRVLAIDPGFRTGCKVVCLDRQGKLEHNTTIFPHTGNKARSDAAVDIKALCERFKINVVAVGNGTASRETVTFLKEINLPSHISIEMVNESGASVYSASDVARQEFPDHDVTVRGAVSIGRRLIDPLAELVKIDPKAIGVGQYQHDVDQSLLRQGLDDTVVSCVNSVGVDVNTASRELLTYVSGLGPSLAGQVVRYREENGPFGSRSIFKKVPRLGPKAFEQAAGFLRIAGGKHPLDASAVHPESYPIVEQMAADLGCTIEQLMRDESLRKRIDLKRYVTDTVGLPTLEDIMQELARPGRDPRAEYESFSFDDSVATLEDVKVGMSLPGIVTNVTNFGAFVDIGVHQDGLVHISELADRFVKDPQEVVKPQQKVQVTVLAVDPERKRISLSMRQRPE
ncbi:S1 RNA-binding domain-containing protein [candidate division GN15 bacterium]|nr:S1 RNA-binding domain-containing protein [candidate division GN15 bacterium]